MKIVKEFCNTIRTRSNEHRKGIEKLIGLHGMIISVLRQEIDSMIRVIFLLSIRDIKEREKLIKQTMNGEKWTVITSNNKKRVVTDKEMVKLSNKLKGWTNSVYRFGCAFIHLSNFHNYNKINPFDLLTLAEQKDVLSHLRKYHRGPQNDNPSFDELAEYFPKVFYKISSNLECYLDDLEKNKIIKIDEV